MAGKVEKLFEQRQSRPTKRDVVGSTGDGKPRRSPCPLCGKPANERYRPFCSKRCADIDLGHWLGEQYRVPAESDESRENDDSSEI